MVMCSYRDICKGRNVLLILLIAFLLTQNGLPGQVDFSSRLDKLQSWQMAP